MTVVSATPGRIRLFLEHQRGNYPLFCRLEREMWHLSGVKRVRASPLAGYLLVHYDPQLLYVEDLLKYIRELIGELEKRKGGVALILESLGRKSDGMVPGQEESKGNRLFKRIALNMMKDFLPKPLSWLF